MKKAQARSGRVFTVRVTNTPCPCGGNMRPGKIDARSQQVDVTNLIGVPAVLHGTFMAIQCERCARVGFPGRMLEAMGEEAVLVLLRLDRRLAGVEARFLRKGGLEMSRDELSERMRRASSEIEAWETADSLDKQQDFEFRTVVMGRLLLNSRLGQPRWKRHRAELIEIMEQALQGPRDVAAPKSVAPHQLAA